MLQTIREKLLFLYHSGKSELQKTPIQAFAALIVIGGILYQIVTSLWPKVASSNPIVIFLQKDTQINITLIALGLVLLVWSFINLRQTPKSKNRTVRKEIAIGGVIWSATKSPNSSRIYMDDDARCEHHDLNLLQDRYSFYCPQFTNRACRISISNHDFYKMKEHAESYLDKLFRDDD